MKEQVAQIFGLTRRRSAAPPEHSGPCGLEFADYFRLMAVDHHTIDHGGFAGVVIIDMNASAGFDSVLVDLSAGFVHVTNRLVEHVTKGIMPVFRADYDYFARLKRGDSAGGSCRCSDYFRPRCWLSTCLLLCSRRARLRKRQRRDHCESESVDYFLHHDCLPFLRCCFTPK